MANVPSRRSLALRTVTVLLLGAAVRTSAFSGQATFSSQAQARTPADLTQAPDVEGRHFQLEEFEDSEASISLVFLASDGVAALGVTDGPICASSRGTWSEAIRASSRDDRAEGRDDARTFAMTLTRRFSSGCDGSDPAAMGRFEYEVERTYVGERYLVGGSVLAMSGEILDVDEFFGERRVGFFQMIDTTEERDRLGV
ncbi:hypothetical protein ACHAWF_002505 [Thalassiosira exigua]